MQLTSAILPLLVPASLLGQLTITARATLTIPATNARGDLVIGQMAGATRFADGTILVLDVGELTLRRFSATGVALGATGRAGEGPGEFRFPSWAGRCGDTAYVFDSFLRRISEIGATGKVGREYRLAEQRDVPPPHDDIRCLQGGGFAWFVDPRPQHGSAPAGSLQVSDLIMIRGDGTLMRRITGLTGAALMAFGNMAVPHPLAGRPRLSATADGVRYGTGATATVSSVVGMAAPQTVRLAIPPRPATRDVVNAAIESVLERYPEADRPNFRPMYAAAPIPAAAPYYRRLVVDSEGLSWLETSLPGSRRTEWLVANAAGRTVATLQLPGRVELYEVGRDYLIGRLVLEDGEEQLVIHGVRRQ